mgnify:FL=1
MAAIALTHKLMDRLERLAVIARRIRPGRYAGDTPTHRRGSSVEFSDYRAYQPGDDFRSIDWNVYGRLGRVYVKQYRAEEDLSMQLLLDVSRSMQYGGQGPAGPKPGGGKGSAGKKRSGGGKLEYGAHLALALGYLALTSLNRVGMAAFAEELKPVLPPRRRIDHFFRLFDYLNSIEAQGETDTNASLEAFARLRREAGVAVVISDLMDPKGYADGITALSSRGWDVLVIHVLSEDEISLPQGGPIRMVDAETGESLEVNLGREEREEYRIYLDHYFREIREFCASHGVEYVLASTAVPFERIVLDYLRGGVFIQ